jgi:hypothetical protein
MIMKRLTILLIAIAILSVAACSNEGDVDVTDPTPPPVVQPDPPPEAGPVVLALKSGDHLRLFDGTNVWVWQYGDVKRARNRVYSSDTVLYALDDMGSTYSSKNIVTVPDKIGITDAPVSGMSMFSAMSTTIDLSETETWIVEDITPEEAQGLGMPYQAYTKVYHNADEYGTWQDRDWYAEKLVTLDQDVYARIGTGAWYHVNGTRDNVRVVVEDGFAVYSYDSTNREAVIDGVSVSWSTNFFNGANEWQLSGGVWYSQNGYSWDGVTLTEDNLCMSDFRDVQNLIIAAGTRYENGEDVLYWINCATGYVIRHVPSADGCIEYVRLYIGDGETLTGMYYKEILKPVIADDYLYFIYDDNQTYRYSFITGLVGVFASGVEEIWTY